MYGNSVNIFRQLVNKPHFWGSKPIPANQDFGQHTPQKNTIELEGIVVETLPNAVFRVQIESGQIILAHIAGKLRVNKIRILPGDKVIVEVTPYDLTRGRVIRRLR